VRPVYAAAGSRKTPPDIFVEAQEFARRLDERGWTVRIGGAKGFDTAIANGSFMAANHRQLYLPWPGYNDRLGADLDEPTEEAFAIAAAYHPAWGRCDETARKLHARNTHVVLGAGCDDPAKFLICWTPGGKAVGGTGQALRLAAAYEVVTFNLAIPDHRERINRFIERDGAAGL
jgi:hypothetical protein